ncbi:MAG: zinc-ribbon domain-containing protein [Candidatus Hodarchaeota archaeon]
MFCSHCGEKLLDPEQKFCQNCGTEILITSKTTDYKQERIPNTTPSKIVYVPVPQKTQVQRGLPGKYSKLCLGQALVSIFIGILSLIIGYNFYRSLYSPPFYYTGTFITAIVILLSRVAGLVLGVLSRVNGAKAENFEPYNDTEKAGSIFAVFGIIINAIGLFLSLFGPWSIFNLPYGYI